MLQPREKLSSDLERSDKNCGLTTFDWPQR